MRPGQAGGEFDLDEGGRGKFIHEATIARRRGAAVVVMAFDETGQADTFARKTEICKRAYDILVNQIDFPPEDIIFDPNILRSPPASKSTTITASTSSRRRAGSGEPAGRACFGGVSNLSFSFRGNEPVREAMHSVFLYHAIHAGMDMGIVNAGQMIVYDDIDPELRQVCEDRHPQPRPRRLGTRLLLAEKFRGKEKQTRNRISPGANGSVEKRLSHALVHGITEVHRGRHRGRAA
jgi:5-methyltetrahydrofolate--homocysteine methyltransferase